jgi:hypothetical protein
MRIESLEAVGVDEKIVDLWRAAGYHGVALRAKFYGTPVTDRADPR